MSDDYQPSDADAPPEEGPSGEPQYDLVAEQSVLGAMMLSARAIDDVMTELVPRDFYQPKHELIAKAIGVLTSRNEPVDAITVGDELRRSGELARVAGGAAYLHELTTAVPTASNAGYYARIVKDTAVKRRLVEVGTRISAMGNSSEGEVEDLLEKARTEFDTVLTGKHRPLQMVGDTFDALIAQLEEKPTYRPTPWESLDKMIGGLAPGSLYIVAARPGSGKTIAVMNMAARLAREGMVAFCSLEMTEAELQKRLLAQFGPVSMTSLRNHSLNDQEWKRAAEARVALQAAPIFIDDQAGVNMAHIRAHARAVARRGKLAGIVVDYLQLVAGEGRDRREIVDSVSRQLKQLAKDLNVPVIAAAQLKRAGQRKGLPGLDDLREAGGIEQDADVVLLLDRDKEKKPHDLTVIVGKNRHGEAGKVTLQWQAHFARLLDKSWSPTALLDEGEL